MPEKAVVNTLNFLKHQPIIPKPEKVTDADIEDKDDLWILASALKGQADILVTGDQSITDVISCCRNHKQIWYQIAPWKKDFATNMFKELPNKYYKTFKTSCGTLSSVKLTIDWASFIKDYDFSTRGKTRMDAILLSHKNSNKITEEISNIIETSRRIDTVINKFKKLNTD